MEKKVLSFTSSSQNSKTFRDLNETLYHLNYILSSSGCLEQVCNTFEEKLISMRNDNKWNAWQSKSGYEILKTRANIG